MGIKYFDYPDKNKDDDTRFYSFALTTGSFIILLFYFITYALLNLSELSVVFDLFFFILTILNVVAIIYSILLNSSVYNKIMSKINGLKKTNKKLNVTEEIKYEMDKEIIVFPIVSFVYLCIIIFILIGINYKCIIKKNK